MDTCKKGSRFETYLLPSSFGVVAYYLHAISIVEFETNIVLICTALSNMYWCCNFVSNFFFLPHGVCCERSLGEYFLCLEAMLHGYFYLEAVPMLDADTSLDTSQTFFELILNHIQFF